MAKSELLAILKEFDEYWREHGTEIDFNEGFRKVKPMVPDLMEWLEKQAAQPSEKESRDKDE